jgi:hypothetical protein
VGKSVVATTLAASISAGRSFLDWGAPSHPGRVLYLTCRWDWGVMLVPRLSCARADRGLVSLWDPPLSSLSKSPELWRRAMEESQADLVVVDSLAHYTRRYGIDPTPAAYRRLSPLARLADEFQAAVLVLGVWSRHAALCAPWARSAYFLDEVVRGEERMLICLKNDHGEPHPLDQFRITGAKTENGIETAAIRPIES